VYVGKKFRNHMRSQGHRAMEEDVLRNPTHPLYHVYKAWKQSMEFQISRYEVDEYVPGCDIAHDVLNRPDERRAPVALEPTILTDAHEFGMLEGLYIQYCLISN
jgi:hypothetical protein